MVPGRSVPDQEVLRLFRRQPSFPRLKREAGTGLQTLPGGSSDMRGTYHIEAPVETVFEHFIDPRKLADLFPDMEIRELKMTDDGTGTYTSYHTKLFGVPLDTFSVYTEVVRNEHITEKSSNAMVGTWDYSFEPEDGGTKLTMEHQSRSLWNLPPLRNVGDLITARMNESFMERVKDRIEASATSRP
jgi:hypothetical protein